MFSYSFFCDKVEFSIAGLGSRGSYWDSQIVMMRVDDFLRSAKTLVKPRSGSLNYIRDRIFSKPICPPMLSFWVGGKFTRVSSHEGRHRATICKEIGMTEIPVALHMACIENLRNGFMTENDEYINPEMTLLG